MANSLKKTTFAEIDEIRPLDLSAAGDSESSDSVNDDVFQTSHCTLQRRRTTQAFVVSCLPSHRASSFVPSENTSLEDAQRLSQERKKRKSVARSHTVAGELRRQSDIEPGSPTSFSTYPRSLLMARRHALARDTLADVAEQLCVMSDVDYLPMDETDSCQVQLLQKDPESRKSTVGEDEHWQKSRVFRERLKSVAVPFAERRAVW